MSQIPILPSRVPDALTAARLTANLRTAFQDLSKLQAQISTGHKLSLPSDDPYAASQTITLKQLLDRKTQMVSNIDTDNAFLSSSDSALASISTSLNQAKAAIMAGIGDSSGPTDKQALEQQLQTLIT